jgi:nucleotide-binding universal stress UspA family protein
MAMFDRRRLLGQGLACLGGAMLAPTWLGPRRAEASGPASPLPTPGAACVKAAYLSYFGVGDRLIRERVFDLADTTELNAIVIDVKGDRGFIPYETRVPLALEAGAVGPVRVRDVEGMLARLRDKGRDSPSSARRGRAQVGVVPRPALGIKVAHVLAHTTRASPTDGSGGAMKKILIPTDFSDCARRAEETAMALGRRLGAELILLHVSVETPLYSEGMRGLVDPRKVYEAQRAWAENTLAARAAEMRGTGVSARGVIQSGVAVDEILKLATEERCDLIVIGTHGRGGLSRFFIGSVADRIVRLAPCPVVTVRLPSEETPP